jgi:hypothetical protein
VCATVPCSTSTNIHGTGLHGWFSISR